MSDLIKLLPDNIANQIAAGEVIQRPASVVKELLENSIDASADQIDVNIKDSGKTLIQIVDNGTGMSPSDAVLCFQRHATSKIKSSEDLFALTTMGFRGEALSSIAAIAHVEMKTRLNNAEVGHLVVVEGGKIKKQEDVVCPTGTSFEVKNLFYNVPARRNFLKKDSTEFKHIQDEFERIALAHPELHLSLKHNGNDVYNLPAAVLRKRIVAILGKGANDRLVPINESSEIVSLKGFVLKPENARKTRGEQFFFVNNRYFKSAYFNHSVNKSFEGLINAKTYPGYFLYLEVDTNKIDVNVHPTKTEIKFEEEKFIYSILLSSIKLALGKYNIAPTLEFDRESSFDIPHHMQSQTPIEPTIKVNDGFNPFDGASRSRGGKSTGKTKDNFSKAIVDQGFGNKEATEKDWGNFYKIEQDDIKPEDSELFGPEEGNKLSADFIVKGGYIITPSKSGLMLINIKRAIEQIVYSDIHKQFISRPLNSQVLLFPLEREILKHETSLWEENNTLLTQLGFKSEIDNGILKISAVPDVLQEETIAASIEEIFASFGYQQIDKGDIAHALIAAISVSASMRKTNLNTKESIQALIDKLFQCENHAYSPRNKKILETFSLDEIYQKFN
jgi:DNA mismatch repair protein MutL